MNKLSVFIIFILFAIGCNVTEQPTKHYIVNTITCWEQQGWVNYKTEYSIYASYGSRSAMWRFKTVDGKTITNNSCYAKGK